MFKSYAYIICIYGTDNFKVSKLYANNSYLVFDFTKMKFVLLSPIFEMIEPFVLSIEVSGIDFPSYLFVPISYEIGILLKSSSSSPILSPVIFASAALPDLVKLLSITSVSVEVPSFLVTFSLPSSKAALFTAAFALVEISPKSVVLPEKYHAVPFQA